MASYLTPLTGYAPPAHPGNARSQGVRYSPSSGSSARLTDHSHFLPSLPPGRLTAEKLADAAPLAEAVAALRRALPKGCILVGQNVSKDVQWLGLREGEDFQGMIDLTGLFRVWNDRYRSYSVFGQDHLAGVLLGMNVGPGIAHNAEIDCIKSIRLFQYYLQIQETLEAFEKAKAALLAVPPQPSFAKLNPTFEGCCMGNRKTCTCGAPFFF